MYTLRSRYVFRFRTIYAKKYTMYWYMRFIYPLPSVCFSQVRYTACARYSGYLLHVLNTSLIRSKIELSCAKKRKYKMEDIS